ncbi:MAG: LCP family protein [Candidatus Nomurabacteria bacterium]|nr:MAG: LCP family protein [Candidatus Nomurabacteria bacterium]
MAKRQTSMDGFVSRRPERRVGGIISGEKSPQSLEGQPKESVHKEEASKITRSGISRAEIDASLRGLDEEEKNQQPVKRRHRRQVGPAQKSNRVKWVKRFALVLLILAVGIGAYVGFKTIVASGNVFQGSVLDLFRNEPLKQDANGRSNILILGTSEDDPGHQGGNLTDSMMILSINQNKKNAYMVSIPRDLYVQYDRACASGYRGKINVYYSCVHDGTGVAADRKALGEAGAFIGKIFGLNIQYGVNVNYTVMRELVKAVGGKITVNIEGDGAVPYGVKPGSIMDSNFDWKCGAGNWRVSYAERLRRCPPRGHFIDYPPGPAVLDAEHVLYLAQARGDAAPTWGLAQSNFDRENNQRKIIVALQQKALSAGVLSDFSKVSAIIDALGNNLRTTFQAKEFRTLVSLAQDIKGSDIKSISLNDPNDLIMTTGNVDGQSVVEPSAGTYDYSQLQSFVHQKLSSDPIIQEAAVVSVYNASGVAGMAQTEADKLEADKFTIGTIGNAPSGNYPRYALYQIGSGNSATANKLKQLYGVKITKGDPPVTVDSTTKFVLIVGKQPASSN